jgi:hypothetical protein
MEHARMADFGRDDDPRFLGPADGRIPLGLALAQLPQEAPDRSAWPALAARLAERAGAPRADAGHAIEPPAAGARTRRLPRWPLALAASVAIGLLALPRWLDTGPGASPAPAVVAATSAAPVADEAQLAALMTESSRLERLIAAADDGTSSATAAALSLELEDRLATLDGALQSNPDPSRQLALWQQRVQVLRDVAAVETSRRYLASEGRNFDVALVAAY